MTALSCAVMQNHLHCVNALLSCGADVNCKDDRNFTPLAIAARHGFLEVLTG